VVAIQLLFLQYDIVGYCGLQLIKKVCKCLSSPFRKDNACSSERITLTLVRGNYEFTMHWPKKSI